ncbi:TPA: helix-turn-helix transcriptional regulator [Stenotrophomonas maltophilia]|uniref:AraC family transcriptional regulator n=1 Tax=Stenotrophomonas maltophilia TaxID=40324 RepID=A0A2J0U7M9_STEMA|nr:MULTISPECIES: helix-turn-helix transcriptional regulator [Stenotrophomonas]PJL25331.1 AraC family transcriptional regulator [Stenotrophomonas maltophilia]HDS1139245.1 helix-turn-helix transcriptional regulator [Stenotrophomonas maltophilia]HDS1146677.1 helix-turn-helix transcriptional regulator [Stenotrophomonas maltophilia]HDS1161401.1 helix-turn-helix transcriptional regulator [Stenotrophomonas maltophilia]HEL5400772.1 helix-turn-helix transcriptional regulator [Stenotrophomonas maltophil
MADQTSPALIDPALADADGGPIVLASQLRVPGRRRTARHQHLRGQLLGAHHGLLRIEAGHLQWLLPAGHVAWIPPSLPHALVGAEGFDGWSLYFSAEACMGLPDLPRIFQPSALLQAAMTRALRWPHPALDAAQARLVGVIIDEIAASTPLPLALPQPQDRRLRKIASALARSPDDLRSVDAWATTSGLSGRSLARRWLAATGMTLSQWRQRLRVLLSLPRLLAGEPVISVALSMGYDTSSAFIAVFKREMGMTPARYAKGDGGD